MVITGKGFTLTDTEEVLVHPLLPVPVIVYWVFVTGFTVMDDPVFVEPEEESQE